MRHTILLGLLAATTGVATAGSPTLILDDFDADPNDDAGGPRSLASQVFTDPFGLGGSFFVATASNLDSDIGAAVFASGTGVSQEGSITWDNDGAGLALDAASLGIVGFELDFYLVDQAFEGGIVLSSGDGSDANDSAVAFFTVSAGNGLQTISLDLGSLDIGAGFDASNVNLVRLYFNQGGETIGLDFAVSEFRAVVPTPGSLALLAFGGLTAIRRRR
ncbi:MAG: hypothetical protein D6692_11085 [Planctomycetota bacterium]|nr:MAG: hypothetical protein D6692_11085 [Planctomycetota bacterium]